MPVVRCPNCDAVIAHLGKSLTFRCPGRHRGRAPGRIHVDRDHVDGWALQRNGEAPDGVHTDAERRARSRAAVERAEARYGI